MKQEKNYNIGLDIGVGSVGWCVTDNENNILKKKIKICGAQEFLMKPVHQQLEEVFVQLEEE